MISPAIGKAGINLSLIVLSDPGTYWRPSDAAQSFHLGDATVSVAISAEDGKVDLNRGDHDLISGIMMVTGGGSGEAETIADAVIARRTGADTGQLAGVGAEPNGNSQHPLLFESLGELMGMPGMTREMYDRVEPDLTLYSGSATVDADLASADVLRAIPGNTRADAEAAIIQRGFDGREDRAGDRTRTIGHAFAVVATAQLPDGTVARRQEIVRLTANPKEPVWVLSRK